MDSDHMIPIDEFEDHEMHEDCKCNPEYTIDDGIHYWLHKRIRPVDAVEYLTDPDNINLN